MRPVIPLLILIDTGTDYTQRLIINPLFILLVEVQAQYFQRLLEAFSIRPRRVEHDRNGR